MEKINRKSFVVYFEWFDNIGDLPPENFKELIMAIQEYAKSGIEPKLDGVTLMAFKFIKGDLERDLEKYISRAKTNRTNGLLGGRPKTEQNPTEPIGLSGLEPKPKKPDNVDDNEDVNEDEVSNDTLLIDDQLPNSFNPIYFTIAKSYHNLFLKTKGKNRTLQNVTSKSYVETIRKLIELDGLTIEQLVAIKLFLEDGANKVRGVDTFWAETIYSVNSLRKKNKDGIFYFDMIAQKAKKWIEMDGNKARVKNAVEYVNSKQCKSQE